MTKYDSFNFRDSAIAMVFSIVFSVSCVLFAAAPAVAAPTITNSVVVPLA